MKPIRSSFKILCLLLVLLIHTAEAQTFKRNRVLSRTFAAFKESELQIVNKYGDINMIPWEKDSIKIDIVLSVVSNKEIKADKAMANIDFDLKATRYYIIAKTVIAGQNKLWSDVNELTGGLIGSGTSTSILYTVYYPNTIRLNVDNKYGDIFLASQKGRSDIRLAHGKLKAHTLDDESTLYLYYSDAVIQSVDRMRLTLNYSECMISTATQLKLDSRASTLTLDECVSTDLMSRRDNIKIARAGSCTGHLILSNCSIGLLNDLSDLQAEFGSLELRNLSKSLKSVQLRARSCEVSIILNKNNSYKTTLQYTDASEVLVPTQLVDKKISEITPDKKTKLLECTMGDPARPSAELNISTVSGSVDIKF